MFECYVNLYFSFKVPTGSIFNAYVNNSIQDEVFHILLILTLN